MLGPWDLQWIETPGVPLSYRVYCENGDIYDLVPGGGSVFVENVFGGATPAAATTWGRLKEEYRR